jgi:1-deoxy-D-xylulose-5-phosphate synthase
MGIPDNFIEHGTVSELQEIVGLDKKSILEEIKKML